MNYYLFRQSATPSKTSISSDEARKWDVIMILKSRSPKVSIGILYQSTNTGIVYVEKVAEYKYDLMDAFGMPHANRKHFSVVVPQEIFSPLYHTTVKYDSRSLVLTASRRFAPHRSSVTSVRLYRRMG